MSHPTRTPADSNHIDLEEGREGAAQAQTQPEPEPEQPKDHPSDTKQSRSERLHLFRDLVGIHPIPSEQGPLHKRPASNEGTYKRLCDALTKRRLAYYAAASFINSCLFIQIVVAAALTALGASAGSHVAVTILGSINTVIAGVMTYLKGQGLPDRIREDANGLRRVREHIEQVERQLTWENSTLDVAHEAEVIYEMYNAVRKNAEDNNPSNWKSLDPSSASARASRLGEKGKERLTQYQSIGAMSESRLQQPPGGAPATRKERRGGAEVISPSAYEDWGAGGADGCGRPLSRIGQNLQRRIDGIDVAMCCMCSRISSSCPPKIRVY